MDFTNCVLQYTECRKECQVKGYYKIDPSCSMCDKWLSICIKDTAKETPPKSTVEEKRHLNNMDKWVKTRKI